MKFRCALLAGGLAMAASAATAEKWDMPMAYPNSNYHTQTGQMFADAVNVCTGGDLEIVVHGGGSLFAGNDIKRAVRTGQAPIGERLLSAHQNENALFGFDSVPFVATSFEDSDKLWKAARPHIEKVLDDQGLVLLYATPWPPQGLYFKKPINGVGDMQGIKFRAYNSATARLAELAGMQPVQIEAAELARALATGIADSFVSSGSTGYDEKVWEYLSHFYDTQAWLPRNYVFANKSAFNGLSEHAQNCLRSSGMLASAVATNSARYLAGWYLSQFTANGMSVQPPGDRLKSDLAAIGKTMADEWSEATGGTGAEIVRDFNAMQ